MKVLVVTKTQINEHDGGSLAIRNWLGDCFPLNTAQIYSGDSKSTVPGFLSYQLKPSDRRLGKIFFMLKGFSRSGVDKRNRSFDQTETKMTFDGFLRSILNRISSKFLSFGFWEKLFKPKLSTEIKIFIESFRPDVVIAQGFDLTFTWLPIEISRVYGVPIYTLLVDDWEPYLYCNSPRVFGMRRLVRHTFEELLVRSSKCFCISSLMVEEYKTRYGCDFGLLMQVDRRSSLNNGFAKNIDKTKVILAYSGSVDLNRWKSLLVVGDALAKLENESIFGILRIYSDDIPDFASSLYPHQKIIVLPSLRDREVIPVLSACDILVMAESFDEEIRRYIKFSISTKCHVYMMTGSVPFVYGPPEIATVRYAIESNWGVVVSEEGTHGLVSALRGVILNDVLRNEKVRNCCETFHKNHSPKSSLFYDFEVSV